MRKKKEINTENYLDKIPAICGDLDWMENNGFVTVVQENKGFYNRLAQKMFKTPEVSNIDFDEFGSFVWLSIDGKNTVFDIGGKVKEKFGEDVEPLYPRLIQFLNVLKEVKYIEFL